MAERKQAEIPLLGRLQHLIDQNIKQEIDVISSGGCKDYEDYRYRCGLIDGLVSAKRDLLDLDEKAVEE